MRIVVLFLLCSTFVCLPNDGTDHADAFNFDRGLTILDNTRIIPGFDARNMFGAVEPASSAGQTIFDDRRPPDDIDYVIFETSEEIPLVGFRLVAGADGVIFLRGTKGFSLKADVDLDGTFEKTLFSGELLPLPTHDVTTNFNQVVARRFRAEFLRWQEVNEAFWSGPRIQELDAIVTPNPVRPTVELTGPLPGIDYIEPGEIEFSATASDDNGIHRVEFYAGESWVGAVTNATGPYHFTWKEVPSGDYFLRAKAVDILGAAEFSQPVQVKVAARALQLTSVKINEGKLFEFQVSPTTPQRNYAVYVSTNLINWSEFAVMTAEEETLAFTDYVPVEGEPARFYKAAYLP